MDESIAQHIKNDQRAWKLAITGIAILIFLLFFIFLNGITSIVSIWISSGAYNHCFLILPIFFYMTWSNRAGLVGLSPRPSLWGSGVILMSAIFWFFSFLSGLAEGVQFAIVGILQGMLLTLFGWRIYLRLLLPFSYLWLLVPSGEFLIPTLQQATAKGAADLLNFIGIPTFRDGLTIEVPSGSYLVAPGCAGLNFVLASLATSIAYAELIYRSWRRRIAFVLALWVLAVVGNVLRVFLIIAIAHATNNIGNIVDDHLLYGWGFFSVILLAAMILGQRFRQDSSPVEESGPKNHASAGSPISILTAAVVSAVLLAAAPTAAWLGWRDVQRPSVSVPLLSCNPLATATAEFRNSSSGKQADALASIDCGRDDRYVHFTVAVLDRHIRQGKLLGLEHRITANENWNPSDRRLTILSIGGHLVPVQAEQEAYGSRRRLIWSLFWADGAWRSPGLMTALADLKAELSGHRRAVLVLAETEIDGDEKSAEDFLREFLTHQPLEQIAVGEPLPGG